MNHLMCQNSQCNKYIVGSGKKYCSLLCANRDLAQKRRRVGPRHIKVCQNPDCSREFGCDDKRQKFCSHSCAASVSNRGRTKNRTFLGNEKDGVPSLPLRDCFWFLCSNKIPRQNKGNYCSKKCEDSDLVRLWFLGEIDGNGKYTIRSFVRRYVLDRADNRCEGYDDRIPGRCTETRVIQVDHINGNWQDSRPYNLRALCPTCHALTPTFGARNKGNGRTWKKGYNQFISIDQLTD